MDREAMRLIGSREAARILGIDNKEIYKLWYSDQLDYWCINGTMKTNRAAIDAYNPSSLCAAQQNKKG